MARCHAGGRRRACEKCDPATLSRAPVGRVTVGYASHVQPYLECLALRLDSDEGSVCYSGDSGPCEGLVDLARGCDILIHMNHYFSGTEPSPEYRAACGNHKDNAVLARRAGVRMLLLTHLLAPIDEPGLRERIVHEIQMEFDGTVVWGEDLMRFSLPRPRHPVRELEL